MTIYPKFHGPREHQNTSVARALNRYYTFSKVANRPIEILRGAAQMVNAHRSLVGRRPIPAIFEYRTESTITRMDVQRHFVERCTSHVCFASSQI